MSPESEEAPSPAPEHDRSSWAIIAYYLLLLAAGAVVYWQFPDLERALTLGHNAEPGFGGPTGGLPSDVPITSPVAEGWAGMLIAALSLLGALAVMLPVTWTYIHIKRRAGYDESVVHALLILPIAVTGIVLIVKGSLALAFSLAGIVAAVRFRTTLKDTKDAVYIFLAIGVGLAAGVQALGVAVILSLVFSAVNLVLWRINFGNIYLDQTWTEGATLGDAVAGAASARSALSIGDTRLLAALSPTELQEVAARMGRMDRYLKAASDDRRERKKYSVLMVYSATVGAAQAAVEPLLEEACIRWGLAEVLPAQGDVSVLEYLVRVRDDVSAGALLDGIRRAAGSAVKAAELRSLKALAKQGD